MGFQTVWISDIVWHTNQKFGFQTSLDFIHFLYISWILASWLPYYHLTFACLKVFSVDVCEAIKAIKNGRSWTLPHFLFFKIWRLFSISSCINWKKSIEIKLDGWPYFSAAVLLQWNAEIWTLKIQEMPKSAHNFAQPKCRNLD